MHRSHIMQKQRRLRVTIIKPEFTTSTESSLRVGGKFCTLGSTLGRKEGWKNKAESSVFPAREICVRPEAERFRPPVVVFVRRGGDHEEGTHVDDGWAEICRKGKLFD